jgi:hypothetical protein
MMLRYHVTLSLCPGHGQSDHLFDFFAMRLANWMQPQYRTRSSVRRALKRWTAEARKHSGFDGNFSYTIIEIQGH